MSEALQISSGEPDLIQVVVDGLRKIPPLEGQGGESGVEKTHTERISLPKSAPISTLWSKIKGIFELSIYINNSMCNMLIPRRYRLRFSGLD